MSLNYTLLLIRLLQNMNPPKRLMGNKCAVPSCSTTKRKNPKARFFFFPKKAAVLPIWIKACKSLSSDGKNLRICDKHFEKKYFGKKKLLLGAVPTLCLNMSAEHIILPKHILIGSNLIPIGSTRCGNIRFEDTERAPKEMEDKNLPELGNMVRMKNNCEEKFKCEG